MKRETDQIKKTIAMLSAMIDDSSSKHDNVSKVMIKSALDNLKKLHKTDKNVKMALRKLIPKKNSGCIYQKKVYRVYDTVLEDYKVLIQEVETGKIKDVYPFEIKFREKK